MNPEPKAVDEKSARRTREEEEEASLSGSGSGSGSDSEEEDDESGSEEEDEDEGTEGSEVNIDLSENEFYKGMCTLLEDENGNNIVAYADLIHDETKNIADSVKSLETIRKDIHRIANCFERLLAIHEAQLAGAGAGAASSTPSSHSHSHSHSHRHSAEDEKSVRTSKSSKSRRE